MPLKIIHHRESIVENEKEKISINIEENLLKMFLFCEKTINITNLILDKINLEEISHQKENDISNNEDYSKNCADLLQIFTLMVGDKVSLLDAIARSTSIMQKICKLANDFGVSLLNEEKDENCEFLTDEDVDVMVQMVKDFGEEQIRKDVRECKEKLTAQETEKMKKMEEIDVYDVYHEETATQEDIFGCNTSISMDDS